MLEVRRDLDLGEEPLDAEHGAELRVEHLERDVAVVLEVAREVDGGHAAAADLALDGVAIGERRVELGDGVDHGGRSPRHAPRARIRGPRRIPEAGLEPARPEGRGILSPLRLPIPPPGHDAENYLATRPSPMRAAWRYSSASGGSVGQPSGRHCGSNPAAAPRRAHPPELPLPPAPLLPHLLQPLPHPLLDREVLRPLHRRQELREVLLLALEDRQPLLLHVDQLRRSASRRCFWSAESPRSTSARAVMRGSRAPAAGARSGCPSYFLFTAPSCASCSSVRPSWLFTICASRWRICACISRGDRWRVGLLRREWRREQRREGAEREEERAIGHHEAISRSISASGSASSVGAAWSSSFIIAAAWAGREVVDAAEGERGLRGAAFARRWSRGGARARWLGRRGSGCGLGR